MYKELKCEDGYFVKANLVDVSHKKIYTGFFEKNILCKECDNIILGENENYACKILYGGKVVGVSMVNEINPNNVEWTKAVGVDYKKFKLFLLSLLWRFSISSDNFYTSVSLGKHEEIIRKMILDGNPGEKLDYPCMLTSYRKHKDLPIHIMSQPTKHRNNSGICYSIMMNGLLYTFFISKSLIPEYVLEFAIGNNNEIKIAHLSKESAEGLIKRYVGHEELPDFSGNNVN